MKKQKLQPQRVIRIVCSICGELLIKAYPWMVIPKNLEGYQLFGCGKCLNKKTNG